MKRIPTKGFTLIELLVVVAIIAILSVIGAAIFSGVQQKARDARRKADLKAISDVLEVNKTQGGYQTLSPSKFTSGKFPNQVDISGISYALGPSLDWLCIASATVADQPAGNWTSPAACPTLPVAFSLISSSLPAVDTASYKICTLLEEISAGNRKVFCLSNKQ